MLQLMIGEMTTREERLGERFRDPVLVNFLFFSCGNRSVVNNLLITCKNERLVKY